MSTGKDLGRDTPDAIELHLTPPPMAQEPSTSNSPNVPCVRVTWRTRRARQPLLVGVLSRTGYRYSQGFSADGAERSFVIALPDPLVGTEITCWARKDRDNRRAVLLELTLTDGETVVGALDDDESVEWIFHAPGVEMPRTDIEMPSDGSRAYDLWHLIHELGQSERASRLFRGESTLYDGAIQSGMVRQWGLSGQPLAKHEESLLREANRYVDIDDRDQLIAACQHIGIPMNVIDFTTCAKVALWFACLPSATGSGGRVRVVEKNNLSGSRVFRPPQIEGRIEAQRGVLVHTESGAISSTQVSKNVMIAEADKETILRCLEEEYGIHRMSLFPDLEMFRRDIEEGRLRFQHTMFAAGEAAVARGNLKAARSHFADCVSSYINQHPEKDGGFFNIFPMRNLALTLAMSREWREALQVADRVLQLATRYSSSNNGRVFRETKRIVADIRSAASVAQSKY